MGTQAPRPQSAWSRNRWLLPVLLALLIIVLIVGVVFGGRIKKAVLGATATPTPPPTSTPIVVTATPTLVAVGPGTPSPTPIVGGAATATPSGNTGPSTPLPGATPFPTVPGVQVGMITRNQTQVNNLQAGADRKDPKYTYYLNPVLVVRKNLPHYGFTQPFSLVSPPVTPTPTPYPGPDSRPYVKTVVLYQGRKFEVYTAQPGRHGPTGIWVIVEIKQIS